MLFSFNKLKSLANLSDEIKINDVVTAINSIGFEVEEYNKFCDVEGIKFGKILEITKNPQADRLNVCRIQFADKERIIQTNADNVRVGTTVIAFVPGSKLNNITFDAKELKGIVSEGMLSAPSEFGINKDLIRADLEGGITAYEDVEDIFIDPIEYLGLNDFMIDVSILSNRSDANSYYIMALELASYFGTKVDLPKLKASLTEEVLDTQIDGAKSFTTLNVNKEVKIDVPTQIFLAKHNIAAKNNWEDLSNLTLLMTGQPTFVYNNDEIKEIKTERVSGLIKLNNRDIETSDNLVVKANNKVIALAGVEAESISKSSDVIIELSRFNIKDVRKNVKTGKVNSQKSAQASKELAYGTTDLAINFISQYFDEMKIMGQQQEKNKEVKFDAKYISMLAGSPITETPKYEQVINSLINLGFNFKDGSVTIPSYRHDIESKQDISEEIFRFYGYDHFSPQPPKKLPSPVKTVKNIYKSIATLGYQEVVTYSLISKELNVFDPFEFNEEIALETFVSKEREVIRNSQTISLLNVVEYNQKRKMEDISIFDIGMINNGFKTVALATTNKSLNQLKQDIVNLLGDVKFERMTNDKYHPGVSAKIIRNNKVIGWFGKPHPSVNQIDAFVAEFILEEHQNKYNFENYSSDPLKSRDITFELKGKEEIGEYINKIKEFNIFDVKIIDTFSKDGINKITVRVLANEEVVAEIDKQFN